MSANPPTPARLAPYRMLDVWRGVASLAVVFFHWSEIAVRRWPDLAASPLYTVSSHGALGVQIFFVISGFCIANAGMATLRRGEPIGAYVRARARRIYPTYWAALCLALAFYFAGYLMARRGAIAGNIFTQTNPLEGTLLSRFANLTLTMAPLRQPNTLAVAWTLCYEVAFYAVVGLALFACGRLRREGAVLPLLHALTTASLVALLLFPGHGVFPLDLWPHFGLGIFVYDILSRPAVRATRWWLGAVLALYAVHIALHDVHIGAMGQMSRPTFLMTALFAVYLLFAYRHDERASRLPGVPALGFIGLFSYSLYLTHTVTIRVVNQAVQALHLPSSGHYLYFVLATLAAVGFAYLFFLLFEKPLLRAGKKAAPPRAVIVPEGVREPAA
jgi:exopolysaccharide production protein ExoZ